MIQQAFSILVIGMATVVAFLILLVYLIRLLGWAVARFLPPVEDVLAAAPSAPAAQSDAPLAVAVAAAHRARASR